MPTQSRVVVIGLDCATPELLFDRFAEDMPTLSRLRAGAAWGPLHSVVPPITMPAWACMMSGRTPGDLGVYGFRNRRGYDYRELALANSSHITAPRIWDTLTAAGRPSVVLGVPGTYPPTPIHGCMVSCFLAPSTKARYTHPAGLAEEIHRVVGDYLLDVDDFRSPELERVAQRTFDLTEQRFRLARHLLTSKNWDLFAFVDMGPDRLHHGFWKYCDPDHPRYEPHNPYAGLFREYYRALDEQLAQLLEVVPDDAAVLLVSDHGGQPMVGGFCVNEWLRREGLLALDAEPVAPTPIDRAAIDWSRTLAWAEGGYYGRIFLNVEGREPQGQVPSGEYDTTLSALTSALERIPSPTGEPMGNRVLRPAEVYPEVTPVAPDLIVYFGDLKWRALAKLGSGPSLYPVDNDTGPDHANHSEYGVFLLAGTDLPAGQRTGLSIYDVAPTLHRLLRLPADPTHRGAPIG